MTSPGTRPRRVEGTEMESTATERSVNVNVKPSRASSVSSATHDVPTSEVLHRPLIQIRSVTLRYGDKVALTEIDLEIPERRVTAFIGPSGCGTSTLLR